MMKRGIVEYFGLGDGHRCGYCGQSDTNVSHGMWAHQLTCQNYEDLINRGWRRSGKYVYKPLMNQLCCPMYTIRCDVSEITLSKSQKKVLKKMRKFLIDGKKTRSDCEARSPSKDALQNQCGTKGKIQEKPKKISNVFESRDAQQKNDSTSSEHMKEKTCRKAKEIRRERKLAKLAKRIENGEISGYDEVLVKKQDNTNDPRKTIEEFIDDLPEKELLAHRLEVKWCRVDLGLAEFMETYRSSFELFCKYQQAIHNDPDCKLTEKRVKILRSCPASQEFSHIFKQEAEIYKKYQMIIHNDPEEECDVEQFKRFLVNSPLIPEDPRPGLPSTGLGAFHQQYYLDGKMIAVGVVDILPHCMSSKYFFYDPDYSFLSLGTYSALREIHFIRSLQRSCPDFKYYYMGYYIHSCQKMRYKGQYHPSYLLCPEAYTFQPIESCLPKLDVTRYSRFDPDNNVDEDVDVENALVLHGREIMPFEVYHQLYVSEAKKEAELQEVKEYASLAGSVAHDILLYRA